MCIITAVLQKYIFDFLFLGGRNLKLFRMLIMECRTDTAMSNVKISSKYTCPYND